MDKIKLFEAFSGVGSQHMALRNIGANYEVVGISEINKFSIQSYMAIHGETNNLGDISQIETASLPDMDLFTYSFPCQDISIVGNKQGLAENSGTRSSLLWECKKVIETKKPKYLMLENVKNLVGRKNKEHFQGWLDYLTTLGYTNYWKVLNAKYYGTPQNRERVFVISILGEHLPFEFLDGELPDDFVIDYTVDTPIPEKYHLKQTYIDNLVFNDYVIQKGEINNIASIENKGLFNAIKRIITDKSIAPTLATCSGGNTHLKIWDSKNQIYRRLLPIEYWRLMGFTDEDFHKAQDSGMSDSQLYFQAGNSISVPVLEMIFKQLIKTQK